VPARCLRSQIGKGPAVGLKFALKAGRSVSESAAVRRTMNGSRGPLAQILGCDAQLTALVCMSPCGEHGGNALASRRGRPGSVPCRRHSCAGLRSCNLFEVLRRTVEGSHTRYVRGSRLGSIGGGSGLAGTALGQDHACWYAENGQRLEDWRDGA
jgi:hypothetical protein